MVGNPSHNLHISTGRKCSSLWFLSVDEGVCVSILLELPSCDFIADNAYVSARILGLFRFDYGSKALLCLRAHLGYKLLCWNGCLD